jgi:hypothetical protein
MTIPAGGVAMSYSYSYSRGLYAGIALNGAIAAANPVYATPFSAPVHHALVASGRAHIQPYTFWLRILYPVDSHSVNVLNYAWFRRPPVRKAEPVQNLLGIVRVRYVKRAQKASLLRADTSSFWSFFRSLQS